MMRKMVRDFANNEIAPFIENMERGEFPREILRKMGELGLMGIPVPEKYGGSAMDFTSYIIAIYELSKVSATVGVILSVHTSVCTNPDCLFWHGRTEKQVCAKACVRGIPRGLLLNRAELRFRCGQLKVTCG